MTRLRRIRRSTAAGPSHVRRRDRPDLVDVTDHAPDESRCRELAEVLGDVVDALQAGGA